MKDVDLHGEGFARLWVCFPFAWDSEIDFLQGNSKMKILCINNQNYTLTQGGTRFTCK